MHSLSICAIGLVVALNQPAFEFSLANVDDNVDVIATTHIPETRRDTRIDQRHVNNAFEQFTHRRQGNGKTAGSWLQEVIVGRLASGALLLAEARSFNEVDNGRRRISKFSACVTRRFQVLAFHVRIFGQVRR